MNQYRILSIDGGGIKGVFPIAFIAAIEESINEKLSDYFDLIVGTSTGGIIALGLGLGFSAKEMLDFYENLAISVFRKNSFVRALRQIAFSKYEGDGLKQALEKCFGDRKLGESRKRLVVPSLNLETGEVYIYKTAHHPRLEKDYKEKVVDVALSTSAAPTYFPSFRHRSGTPLIDGGMFANNPVGLAAIEAVTVLGWPRESLKILSLGCTAQPFDVNLARKFGLGSCYWGLKVVDTFLASQSSLSKGTAELLVGKENIKRIDSVVASGRFSLDGIKEIPSLKGLGDSEARKALPEIRKTFLGAKAEEFKPYHQLRS